jgi:hypothetical protein
MKVMLVKQSIVALLFLLHVLTGCIDKVDSPHSNFNPTPVVNSIMVTGKPIKVNVSLAVGLQAPKASVVDNAEVLLYVNNQLAEPLEHTGNGIYKSQLVAQEETEYRCEVTIPGHPTAIGSTYIPKHSKVKITEHIDIAGADEEGWPFAAVRVSFSNTPDKTTYYQIAIKIIREDRVRTQLQTSNIVDPVLLSEGLPLLVFNNQTIQGNSYTMTINYGNGHNEYLNGVNDPIWTLDPVQIELRTVSHDYYKYIKQLYLYEQSTGEPLLTPGATSHFKLHSNIENGYGIFTGYSWANSSIHTPK